MPITDYDRINAYRIMWILVMFDLPTDTKAARKRYALFRKQVLQDGFQMFQFSMYLRHCPSRENADVHVKRIKRILLAEGHIGILTVTDKQFSSMEIFRGHRAVKGPANVQQLEMF